MGKNTGSHRAEIEKLMAGHRMTDVLCAGVELGVFDIVAEKPRNAARVAKALDADPRGVEILLNAMAALGLLSKKKDRFHLTAMSKELLVPGSPGYMGNMVRHVSGMRQSWMTLAERAKTGAPFPRPEKTAKDRKERTRRFISAMADGSRATAPALAAALDLEGVEKVLDVGGGPGIYLFEILRAKPGARGWVFDLPATLEITREFIESENMGDAAGTIEGDFNADPLGKGYDLVLMSSIIHIYSSAENRKLVKKGYRALNPGGQLVVKDFLLDPSGTSPLQAALFSVNMLVHTEGGAAYTEREVRSWMKSAGFEGVKRKDLPPRSSILAGRKPARGKKAAGKKKRK